ncbi:TIGR02265 family protein [Melittangium boletus]|uniref:TIGR02265 family protein n=1 Tax=Melittangium boletus TaxID=83453 RepID=UPI003DA315AC
MADAPGSAVSLPFGSDEELHHRISLTGHGDVARGIFLNSLLDMLRQYGDEELLRQCLEVSGEQRFLEFFNYPMSTFLRMAYPAAWRMGHLYGGFEGAFREMGYQASKAFYASSAGKVLLLLARNEPLRLLNNMPTTTNAVLGDNTGITQMKRTGKTSGVLTYMRDLVPRPYNEGALKSSLEAVGAKDVRVVSHPLAEYDTDYEVSWT